MVAFLGGCASTAGITPGTSRDAGPLTPFASMAGCWQSQEGDRVATELWLRPSRNEMMGLSQSVRNGLTTGYEFMRLSVTDNGGVVFTAMPSGQATTSFSLHSLNGGEAIFVNSQHDFPKRIVYRLPATETLAAYIDGDINGETQRIDFVKTRASCDLTGGSGSL